MSELLDDDGENRAVRTFLQLYGGTSSVTTDRMRMHLAESGFEDYWPEWTVQSMYLTKGGAQNWLRYLFALEGAAQPEQTVMEQLQETAKDLAAHGLLDTPSDEGDKQ